MSEAFSESVETKGVGSAPIIRHYFEKCAIVDIIDDKVRCDPRRQGISHGEACVAMITSILYQVLGLYKISKFAQDTEILNVILPGIEAKEYFDDRLVDTLDALYSYGLGNLEVELTRWMLSAFDVKAEVCHGDTTSASVYGAYKNSSQSEDDIELTYGYSKKHRADLKQLVWFMSVSSDSSFPLFQEAYSGNTADTKTYIKQWHNLIEVLGEQEFLYVCDSKLITRENMSHIHDNGGYFIAPAPMYKQYKEVFYRALESHRQEVLIPFKEGFRRGFEVPMHLEWEQKEYKFRMLILYDDKLHKRKSRTLERHVADTKAAFEKQAAKLNRYRLKSEHAVDAACKGILRRYKTSDFFTYTIINEPQISWKNAKKGRPAKGKVPEKIPVSRDCFRVELHFSEDAFAKALSRCGYYPLITNKAEEDLSIEDAMKAHKNQYKSEHVNRRAKSEHRLEPIYLHSPKRIEAYLFLFKIALQILVLIERTARKNIEKRDRGLDNFRPNQKDVRNPKTEHMLKEFQYIVAGQIPLPDGSKQGFVSKLNKLQRDILSLLEVPAECFTYEWIFRTGESPPNK